VKRRLQKPCCVRQSEFFGPGSESAVARHLVMFDCLSSGEKARIKRRHSLEVFHDLGALFGDAVDGRTGLPTWRLADDLEDLIETPHLAFGLPKMFREGLLQIFRLCCLRHFWKRFENLILGKIN